MKGYVNKVHNFKGGSGWYLDGNPVVIRKDDIRKKIVDFVFPAKPTAAQKQIIDRVEDYAKERDISVTIGVE